MCSGTPTYYVFTPDNLDDSTAADGKCSLKISTDLAIKQAGVPFRGFNLETKLYRLPPDATYTVSFYAKSDSAIPLTVEVYGLRADVRAYEKVAHFGGVVNIVRYPSEVP